MKKLMSYLLAACLLLTVFVIAGCTEENPENPASSGAQTTAAPADPSADPGATSAEPTQTTQEPTQTTAEPSTPEPVHPNPDYPYSPVV